MRGKRTTKGLRWRDVRALGFCAVTIPLAFLGALMLLGAWPPALAAALAYAAWLVTRPRLTRVFRRMRGETVDRSSYYRN